MSRLFKNSITNPSAVAINSEGRSYTYGELNQNVHILASYMLATVDDLGEQRVAFMVDPGFDYVVVQWAIWKAGGVAVPLCVSHPLPSLTYVLEDTAASILIVSPVYASLLSGYALQEGIRFIVLDRQIETGLVHLPNIESTRRAMILYTSGTTSRPKGVVTTHANLEAQISTLVEAWRWTAADHTVCVLPLHHVHGIVNVVCCSLWAGATCTFLPVFSPKDLFNLFNSGDINIFMAVPTIYHKLIAYWDQCNAADQKKITDSLFPFRLMISGSAALPVSVMEKWETISGHRLLERYGMTEVGMAISNPYLGERKAGFIGQPLPGVGVRLVDEEYRDVSAGLPGEILVKGETVFLEYWNRPDETSRSFTEDGWFKTGDVAVVEESYYRIMGRQSVDIIKSGGYKISALEIEEVIRTHGSIVDVAVVGIPDEEWGERIVAALVASENGFSPDTALTDWLRQRIPSYRLPRKYLVVNELPRNAMGKVVKNDVKKLFQS